MRCESVPKAMPPIIAPTLAMIVITEMVLGVILCWAPRNWLGYRSCEPWLKKLNAIITKAAKATSPACWRSTVQILTLCSTSLRASQSGLSGTVRRI